MRIFRYWVREPFSLSIRGETIPSSCLGGSNHSPEEAKKDASARFEAVRLRLSGRKPSSEDYVADILEEPLHALNTNNIITRNRYGAAILNSRDHVFIDIDRPPSRFLDFFPVFRKRQTPKERILELLERISLGEEWSRAGFRVYETHSGIRVILTGISLEPRSGECRKILKDFSCDPIYAALCRKQGCFRARLTPKPYRIKVKGHKVRYPRNDGEESSLRNWVQIYDQSRTGFATCRFVKSYGQSATDDVITWHDQRTDAFSGKPLA